jgi:hypothetical protein
MQLQLDLIRLMWAAVCSCQLLSFDQSPLHGADDIPMPGMIGELQIQHRHQLLGIR